MLPPNVNPPEGEGYVTFSISPYYLSHGTEISNRAAIKFDYNPWMAAPEEGPVVNTIDEFPPSSMVLPLGDSVSTPFVVQWEGTDLPSENLGFGSGIRGYAIYVSDNGGPYEMWIDNTLDTDSTYTGEDGHIYCFYSILRIALGTWRGHPTGPMPVLIPRLV